MTLRVSLDIVPYGQEENKYPIYRLDISNMKEIENLGFGNVYCEYKAKVMRYNNETMQTLLKSPEWEVEDEFYVQHNRKDGAKELVRKVLTVLSQQDGLD